MKITSPVFNDNEFIPKEYTCDGKNINPPLDFDDFPEETKELALIVDDPDAPGKTFVHWLVYNMSKKLHIDRDSVPATQGRNDFGDVGYGGPCPPSGEHRYYFKLYALDTKLELDEGLNKKQLEEAMEGHVLEDAELVGLYVRKEILE